MLCMICGKKTQYFTIIIIMLATRKIVFRRTKYIQLVFACLA